MARNADTIVGDRYAHRTLVAIAANADVAAFRRELHGIGQQVQQHLFQSTLVPGDFDFRVAGLLERDLAFLCSGLDDTQTLIYQAARADWLDGKRELPRLNLRHVEDIVDHLQQVAPALGDVLGVISIFVMPDRTEELLRHDFREADDGVQRCPQLMADIGEELGFGLAGFFRAGFFLGVFVREFDELAGLAFQLLARLLQLLDRGAQFAFAMGQAALVTLQRSDVGGDTDEVAGARAPLRDHDPAAVVQLDVVVCRARLRRASRRAGALRDAALRGLAQLCVGHSQRGLIAGEAIKLREAPVAENQPLAAVP